MIVFLTPHISTVFPCVSITQFSVHDIRIYCDTVHAIVILSPHQIALDLCTPISSITLDVAHGTRMMGLGKLKPLDTNLTSRECEDYLGRFEILHLTNNNLRGEKTIALLHFLAMRLCVADISGFSNISSEAINMNYFCFVFDLSVLIPRTEQNSVRGIVHKISVFETSFPSSR